jgi:hypothetical protein
MRRASLLEIEMEPDGVKGTVDEGVRMNLLLGAEIMGIAKRTPLASGQGVTFPIVTWQDDPTRRAQ